MMLKFGLAAAILALLAACAPPQPPEPRAALAPDWQVACTSDPVTNQRRCRAGTFGALMDHAGQPIGRYSIPFHVYYDNIAGPYIMAGFHTFPGRRPEIRFDNDAAAMTVSDDGGVALRRPDPAIVARMQRASVARVRFHSWPDGSRDIVVDMTGFPAAWAQLQAIRR